MNDEERATALAKLGRQAEAADLVLALEPGRFLVLKNRLGDLTAISTNDLHQMLRQHTENGTPATVVVISA